MLPKALRFLLPSPLQFVLIALSLSAGFAAGQSSPETFAVSRGPVADRLTQPIVESARTTLHGTIHPLANKANDRGAVGDGMKLDRIQVVLKRSDAQEQSLKQLIAAMHTPGSASYHKWLTPDQFGKQFGPSDADVAKLEGWLGSHGFSITKLNAGRQTLEIAGTAGQFRDTFHAAIHSYQVKGETRFANSNDPDIPTAIAPVFGGFASLNNFRLKSHTKMLGKAEFNPVTHESKPEWTVSNPDGSISLALAPGDFDVQYDLNPLYAAGTNGTGQSIAIINESNINLQLVSNYRTLFNLQPLTNLPQVIIDGNDPGIDGINSPLGPNYASGEAYLDVEISGSVAPAAQINLVIADDTALESGLFLAAERAVYSNISPVLSISFGECETDQGSSNAFINSLWEQAAAQGITVMVSTGDNGSAGCDNDNSQYYAVYGQAVNGLASTPYNVAVGGTDFYYSSGNSTQLSTYWNLTPNNTTPTVSLLSKIPEQPWNESQYGSNLNSVYVESGDTETSIAGGSGGASTAGFLETTGSYGPYPKPSWQVGAGVPNDSARDLPDVSLFASSGINDTFYPYCGSDGDCLPSTTAVQISGAGGTSFASPAFAGIMALVNQKYGRQGQANYVLYPLAAQFPTAFNDVTVGTITVPCATTIVYDSNNGGAAIAPKDCIAAPTPLTVTDNEFGTTTEGEIGLAAGTPAYNAGTGYDLATGLGTIDAANLVNNWASVRTGASATTLAITPTTFVHGTAVTVSGSVTPATGGTTPAGVVGLLTTSTDPSKQNVGYIPLTAGSYSESLNTLPGGTYDVSTYFAGDSTNAPSTSSPVLVTVTPEASTTLLQVYSAANSSSNIAPISSGGGTYTYGIPLIVSAQPQNSAGKVTTVPTGSVVFSDSGKTINTAVVNVEGDAEYNAAFSPGSHSVTAAYSGDGSYGASTSSAVAFTVAKATPAITAIDYDSYQGQGIVESNGAFFTVLVENQSSFSGLPFAAPTGTLTFTGGPSGTQSATLTPGFDPNNGYPAGIAIFQVPAGAKLGNYTFNFSYGGDTNYNTASAAIPETLNSYTGGLVSTVTATASPTQTSPAAAVQVTVNVTGQTSGGAPTGTVYLISNGDTTYAVGVANLPTASGNSVMVTIPVNSESLYQGTNQITAYYPGDNTYYPSSATVTIANPLSDFSLVPVTTIVNVPGTGVNAGVQTDVINLSSYNGFAGTVNLTCAGAGGVTCALSQSSATLAAGGTAPITLTVNSSAAAAAGTYSVVVTGTNSAGNVIHTIGLQVVTPLVVGFNLTGTGSSIAIAAPGGSGTSTVTATPTNGFTGTVDFTCAVTASPAGATGTPTCSLAPAAGTFAGTAAVTSTLTVATSSTTTAGAYTVTITATSGAITETANVAVTVAAPGSFTLSGTAVTIASQGGTGTSTVTVTPANAFTGTVTLTCAVTAAPTGAIDEPTCSAASAVVTGAGAATTTLTINTTAQTAKLTMPLKGIFTFGGGAALATMLLFGVPFSRRGRRSLSAVRTIRLLAVALLFGLIAGAGIGCGGGGSSGGGGGGGSTPSGGTTTGAYTITVTGTSGTTTATITVAVTVN